MSRYLPGTQSISNIGGNVGINTLSPSYTLDVGGNINLTGQLYKSGSTFNTIGGKDEQIIFNASGSSTGSNAFTFDKTNSVVYANDLRINNNAIHLGLFAGTVNQNYSAVAIGNSAGRNVQNNKSIAIGFNAGYINQGTGYKSYAGINSTGSSIAIGEYAGYTEQGNNSIAIGRGAGYQNQYPGSIILYASDLPTDFGYLTSTAAGFYVKPIRAVDGNTQILTWSNSNGEIVSTTNLTTNNITATSNMSATNFTGGFVSSNDTIVNNNSVPRKWYAFNSSFTGTTNPLQLTFNFDTPSFSANITSILNSVSITGATSCNKMDVIGGGYSSSLYDILVVNNVVSSNTGAIDGNMIWDNTSNIVTPTTLQFSTTSHPAPDEIFSYYINVEMVNGRLISITDNSTPNPNFILYSY